MEHNTPCTIGLGSNTPDRELQIEQALIYIRGILTDAKVSTIYESEAYNGKDNPYLNAVIHGKSSVSEHELEKRLKEFEQRQGRTPEESQKGIIPIDLDLVIWDSRIIRPMDFERHYFNRGYRELLAAGAFLQDD